MLSQIMKNASEMIGVVILTEEYGNVKIIDFKEHEEWGGRVNIYLDKAHMDTCIGSFYTKGNINGGALIVEQTNEPETIFE